MLFLVLLILIFSTAPRPNFLVGAATTRFFDEMTGASPEELCTAYCQEYHAPLACAPYDIASSAWSSARALRDVEQSAAGAVIIPACVQGCLASGMRFDGTPQDFQNANTIQCRRNHIRMQIQEQTLANSDHCLHAMLQGRERCNPWMISTMWYSMLHRMGASHFWRPWRFFSLASISRLMAYGLGAIYEGALRGRLQIQYPYLEIPNTLGRTCDSAAAQRFRSADGTCNSLELPLMGAVDTTFVQILRSSQPRTDLPDPQAVAAILKRPETIDPDKHLAPFNQLVVGWIQMMTHDWFAHDSNNGNNNRVTHWWDASQLYGSTEDQQARVRTSDGKLHLDLNGEIDYETSNDNATAANNSSTDVLRPITGFSNNWWAGLHAMHTLFAREHNFIVDQLQAQYPNQYSPEEQFQLARLCVSALVAKIHTLEWTPTLLANPVASIGLNANWRSGETAMLDYGSRLELNLAYAIVGRYYVPYAGSPNDSTQQSLYNTTFQMAEEFVSVYRMHPLLPDELILDNDNDGITTLTLNDLSFVDARTLVPDAATTTQTLLRSLAQTPSRTLGLQNYPRELYNLQTGNSSTTINLAAIDILRDRERGLPRYNDMRRQLLLEPYESIDDLTSDPEERRLLKTVYSDMDQIDLMVGSLVDQERPEGFAFGIVPFHIFLVVASRRILNDRFLMQDFNADVYTEWGYNFVQKETFRSVLARHFPELEPNMPENPFMNWPTSSSARVRRRQD